MKVLVIGGTGHIGSYLVPKLFTAGFEVAVIARKPVPQYANPGIIWNQVEWIIADRVSEEKDRSWLSRMKEINVDVVIDLLCFTPGQNSLMVEAFAGRVSQFIHCGSIWAYGIPERVPYEEYFPRKPYTEYGIHKMQIESDLKRAWESSGFPATIIHPGHISSKNWMIIDPQGSINELDVYRKLANGGIVHLANDGTATLHHVHADDVAQIFVKCILNREQALGESFSAVGPYALSLVGCCNHVAGLFGREPNLEFVPLDNLEAHVGKEAFGCIEPHVRHNQCCSISKGRERLGYSPKFTSEEIYTEVVEHLVVSGQITL